jgi:hypothetical protein
MNCVRVESNLIANDRTQRDGVIEVDRDDPATGRGSIPEGPG